MNAKEHVTYAGSKETALGKYDSFDAEPSIIYPAAIAELTDLLAHPEKRSNTESERFYLRKAERLPEEAWALVDWDASPVNGASELKPDDLVLRAKALEIARLYFTAMLHQQHGSSIHLHILKDPKYKLHVDVEV